MTKYAKYGFYLLPVACALQWAACTQDRQPCLTPKIASMNVRTVRITSRADTTARDTAMPSSVFIPLTTTGAHGAKYISQSAYTLSLASVADSCKWAVANDTLGTAFDTISFYYDRQLQFISNACGFAYFYQLKNVSATHHFIDSLRITNPNVTNNVNTSHLQVFIHPNF